MTNEVLHQAWESVEFLPQCKSSCVLSISRLCCKSICPSNVHIDLGAALAFHFLSQFLRFQNPLLQNMYTFCFQSLRLFGEQPLFLECFYQVLVSVFLLLFKVCEPEVGLEAVLKVHLEPTDHLLISDEAIFIDLCFNFLQKLAWLACWIFIALPCQ